jgi:CheY-like chemotaxis protein
MESKVKGEPTLGPTTLFFQTAHFARLSGQSLPTALLLPCNIGNRSRQNAYRNRGERFGNQVANANRRLESLWRFHRRVVIGEASNLSETIHKTAELLPDVVIMDLRMTARANGDSNPLRIGRPTVAISFAIDEIAREQAERLGAVKFIDKIKLAEELVPTLLQFAPSK